MRTFIYCILIIACLLQAVLGVTTKHRVTTIPGYNGPAIESYNGYLFVKPESDGHLFYWHVPMANPKGNDPLIIWFNGGPGCSSMIGFFIEHGPFQLYEAGRLKANPYSWHTIANLLYIDQPVAVGLSYPWQENPFIPTSSTQGAVDIMNGLAEFFKQFPDMANRDIYLAGESYAGKYIPYLYNAYLNQNRIKLNIKGILLGNAMIKPSVQYISYPNHGYSSGLFSYRQRVDSVMKYETCLGELQTGDLTKIEQGSCSPLFINMLHNAGRLSPYDIRQLFEATQAEDIIIDYLRDETVKQAFSISTHSKFHKCYSMIHHKYANEFHADVPDSVILRMFNSTNVILYNGQFDLRVSHYGTSEFLRRLNWEHRERFNVLYPTVYYSDVNSQAAGQFKTIGRTTQAEIYGGSHMTPVTVPQATHEMVRRFIYQNNNLCLPTDLNCASKAIDCANECSRNGVCDKNSGVCACKPGFTGVDCGIASFSVSENTVGMINQGAMTGRDVAVYQYRFTPSVSLVDVDIQLNRGSISGLPFVFVNVSSETLNPTGEFVRNYLREIAESNLFGSSFEKKGFAAFNTSHDSVKVLSLKDQPVYRGIETVVYVAVYNGNDYAVSFNMTVSIKPTVSSANWMFITLAGSVILVVIVAMEITILVQQFNRKQQLMKSNNYRQVLMGEDDDSLVNRRQEQQQPLIR